MVDARGEEADHRILRRFHDRLALDVEGRVDQHGHAGQCIELFQHAIELWIGRLAHGLHPRGAVDMHDARDPVAPFRPHGFCDQHEGRILLALKDVVHPLGQHDRRERPECLPVLDAAVEDVLHFGPAGIGEQAAVAERARPEFGRPLEPADHLLIGEQLCGVAADIAAAHRSDLDSDQRFLLRVDDLVLAVNAAGVGVLHHTGAALFQYFEPAVIGTADRDAVVAGRGLDPDVLEPPSRAMRPLATQFSATPPARQRFFAPVVSRSQRVRASSTFSVSSCTRQARSSQCRIDGMFSQSPAPSR